MRKKTHQEFLEEVKKKNAHVIIIGEYTRDVDKVEVECVYCNRRFYMTAGNILAGKKCELCAHKMAARKITSQRDVLFCPNSFVTKTVRVQKLYIG